MGEVGLEKIRGGYGVPGFGTVTRAGVLRPSKELRTTDGRVFRVDAHTRTSTVTDGSGAVVGRFRRNFWTRHGVVEWGAEQFDFRAGTWTMAYQLERSGRQVAAVKFRVLGTATLTVEDDLDPALALFLVALSAITKSYAGAAAASASTP